MIFYSRIKANIILNMKKFFYRVEKGDTAKTVSEKFNLPITLLCELNALTKEIEEGDLLYIETDPSRKLYKVNLFDTVDSLAEKFGVLPEKILSQNGISYIYYGLKIKI